MPYILWLQDFGIQHFGGKHTSQSAASCFLMKMESVHGPWCHPSDTGGGNSGGAERAGARRPAAVAGRHEVCDDAADIALLRRIVVRSGVVARHGHRPCLVTGVEVGQELRGEIDIAARIEHLGRRSEGAMVVVPVDLHAAEIDQLLAFGARRVEDPDGLCRGRREDGLAFYIEGIGLQRSLAAGFGEADGIENAGGDGIALGGGQDLAFAGAGAALGRGRSARCRRRQCE